ncbi:MAG TPA: hypothetical protein VEW46_13500 [Pyrinomonadaceae bacterium]|nr:hypothetical protein [Pyrinomonadaceae bacterium]
MKFTAALIQPFDCFPATSVPGQIIVQRNYGELPLISCYAGQLNEVWMNLLVNAAQAITGRGEVKISTSLKLRALNC